MVPLSTDLILCWWGVLNGIENSLAQALVACDRVTNSNSHERGVATSLVTHGPL